MFHVSAVFDAELGNIYPQLYAGGRESLTLEAGSGRFFSGHETPRDGETPKALVGKYVIRFGGFLEFLHFVRRGRDLRKGHEMVS